MVIEPGRIINDFIEPNKRQYAIPVYQRNYEWSKEQCIKLFSDIVQAYKKDKSHFCGSVVYALMKEEHNIHYYIIIDGQQRFSSLTLLLMYLNNRLKKIGQSYNMIETMIFSESFGTKSFNINVEERQECMEAIFNNKDFDTTGYGESVKNLYGRYTDIESIFPEDITDEMLLHFCDWLAEKVFFIEIVATTEQDAHKVFVTMNDRGLSLTSTEML